MNNYFVYFRHENSIPMRKFCFILLSTVFIGTAWGQVSSEINRSRIPSPALSANKPGTINQSAGEKLILWSSNFSGMNDWTIGNSAGNNANWEIASSPYFWWSGNLPLASSSGSYAASFNSDAFATANNQVVNNAWIQTSAPIDCSGHNGIEVSFEQFYSKWTSRTFIEVSTDNGQSWTDFEVNSSMIGNETTGNPSLATVNISSAAGNQQSVLIRILFLSNAISDGGTDNTAGVAWDYGWIVDDFKVKTLPSNDIALLDAWHANINEGLEYAVVPMSQVREMVPTLVVQNQGSMNQTTNIQCLISQGSGLVDTVTVNHTSQFGSTDTVYFYSGFTPSAVDEYEVSFSIPNDADVSDNNISALPLHVSEYVMGHDYNVVGVYGWDPESSNPDIVEMANGVHSWGNIFTLEANQPIYSVGVNFAEGTTDWLPVKIRVQRFYDNGTVQDSLVLVDEIEYNVPPGAIGNGITNISFDSPSVLFDGETYLIDVVKVESGTTNQALILGGSDIGSEDDDFSTVGFGPYGTGGTIDYYLNWGFAPVIRANFSEELSVDFGVISDIVIYPNPTTGIITINDSPGEKIVEVHDVLGNKLLKTTMNTETSIDLSGSPSGVYFITVSDESNSFVERVVLK